MAQLVSLNTKQERSIQFPNLFQKIIHGENKNVLINWFSGLTAGLCTVSIFSPFDLARTRHIIQVI